MRTRFFFAKKIVWLEWIFLLFPNPKMTVNEGPYHVGFAKFGTRWADPFFIPDIVLVKILRFAI